MSNPEVLILEDDQFWRDEHFKRLTDAGFNCCICDSAEAAINLARQYPSLRFGLIDEILQTPEKPDDPAEQQRWQGKDAIRQLAQVIPDMWFAFVTKAPLVRSDGDVTKLAEEIQLLRQVSPRVVSIYIKSSFEENPSESYAMLIGLLLELFKQGNPSQSVIDIRSGGEIAVYQIDNDGSINTEPGIVEIFFSYSPDDQSLRDKLEVHLSTLKREGKVRCWHSRQITAGKEWQGEIDHHLNNAHIILLLLSANFIASDYCFDREVQRAIERHEVGEARVIPILLKAFDLGEMPFNSLQFLPSDRRPVTSWQNEDEAFTHIAQGIRTVVDEVIASIKSHSNEN